jgi:large subunit ribosomal protein L32
MALPKRKTSKSRRDKRRAHWKIEAPNYSLCPHCKHPRLSHTVCPNCGYYKNKPVVSMVREEMRERRRERKRREVAEEAEREEERRER